MDENYAYFVSYVRGLPDSGKLRILDYGCGNGAIVAALRGAGFDAVGCDTFYAGGSKHGGKPGREFESLLEGGQIRAIEEKGDLPWPPRSFDVVLANQVFEHVTDFDATIARIERVLATNGHLVLHFPSREVWREGHIGIPFSHRFASGSRFRTLYTRILRGVGMGYHTSGKTASEWTNYALEWLDRYCVYRPYRTIRASLDRDWEVRHNEWQYIRFRARDKAVLIRWLLNLRSLKAFLESLFRRLGFMALVLRRRDRTGDE
jgi:SAM-dependent methyltransferase